MILAPLVGIILNLWDASAELEYKEYNDVVGIFASMECLNTVNCGFRLLLDYNWVSPLPLSLSLSPYIYIYVYLILLCLCVFVFCADI